VQSGGVKMSYVMLIMAVSIVIVGIIDAVATVAAITCEKAWHLIWQKKKSIYFTVTMDIVASIFAFLYILGY
jgi:dolichol kinase